jgi:hypothetical protein
MRIYVFLGQGGRAWSGGMVSLARWLEQGFPQAKVKICEWHTWQQVAREIQGVSALEPVVLIGFSLGGNAVVWIARSLRNTTRIVQLLVAYDPTVHSDLNTGFGGPIESNVRKAICFFNDGWDMFGMGKLTGKVENVRAAGGMFQHLRIQHMQVLHDRVWREIKAVWDEYAASSRRT